MQVIQQRAWTEAELKAKGFTYYQRAKQLVMAGRLPESFAPLRIDYGFEFGIAHAGDILIYDPGSEPHPRWRDYTYWSVKPEIFRSTYTVWDEPDWTPNAPQRHLMRLNCRPYYKKVGAWAKRLKMPTLVQSIENPEPIYVPIGFWLLIGDQGEPWHADDASFHARYILPAGVS